MSAPNSYNPTSPRGDSRSSSRRVHSVSNHPASTNSDPAHRRAQGIPSRSNTHRNTGTPNLAAIYATQLVALIEDADHRKALHKSHITLANAERDAPVLEAQRRARRAAAPKSTVETEDESPASTSGCPSTPRRAKPLVDYRKKAPKTPQRPRHSDGGQIEHVPVHRTPRTDVRFNPSDTSGRNKPVSARSAPREVVDPCATPKAAHRTLFPDPALLATPGYTFADDDVADMLMSTESMSFSGGTATLSSYGGATPGLTASGSTTSDHSQDDEADFSSSDFRRQLHRKLLDEKLASLCEDLRARKQDVYRRQRALAEREQDLEDRERQERQNQINTLQAERHALDEERRRHCRQLQTYELLLRNILMVSAEDARYHASLNQITFNDARERTDEYLLLKFALLEKISHQLSDLKAAPPASAAQELHPRDTTSSFCPIKDTEFLHTRTPEVIVSYPSYAPEVMMESIQSLEDVLKDWSMGNIPEDAAVDMDSSMATMHESIMDASMVTVMDEDFPIPSAPSQYTHTASHLSQSGAPTDPHAPPKLGDPFWRTNIDQSRDPRPDPPLATPTPRRGDPFWKTYVNSKFDPRNNPHPSRADAHQGPSSEPQAIPAELLQSTAFDIPQATLEAALHYWGQYDKFWRLVESGEVHPNDVAISDFVWPLFCDPTEDLDSGDLAQRFMVFFFHPQRPSMASLGGVQQVIRTELKRWHPDKCNRFQQVCADPRTKALLQLMGSRVTGYLTAALERLRSGLPLDPARGPTA